MSDMMMLDISVSQQTGVGRAHDKRKPVRRDPERRRQQNIQAQRKYREKLRQRLDKPEALAASAAETRTGTNASGIAATATAQALSTPSSAPSIVELAKVSQPATPVHSPWEAYPTTQFIHFPPQYSEYTPQSDDTSSSSDLSLWDSNTYIDPSFLIRDKRPNRKDCTFAVDCGCSTSHSHVLSRNPDAFTRGDFKILTFSGRSAVADPLMNTLRLEMICTLGAMSALGTYIGITQEILCADESLSPFFRPGTASPDKDATVRTVQRIFKTLKPDLRPSRRQITVEHHPYIDILPFPTLRDNLIVHKNVKPTFDEEEFFEDILAGLVCWGGAGVGQRDRDASTGHASTGTPWDVRSWEAKAWFVKKYWELLGGEDGELVRQSEWWRGVRGDESLDVAVCGEEGVCERIYLCA